MKSTKNAYLLWMLGLIGVCGMHRFYMGKRVSGLIWLLTIGLVGVGQIVDLIVMRKLIAQCNGVPGRVEAVTAPSSIGFVPRATSVAGAYGAAEGETTPLSDSYDSDESRDAA